VSFAVKEKRRLVSRVDDGGRHLIMMARLQVLLFGCHLGSNLVATLNDRNTRETEFSVCSHTKVSPGDPTEAQGKLQIAPQETPGNPGPWRLKEVAEGLNPQMV
jgi:hypothetical protein